MRDNYKRTFTKCKKYPRNTTNNNYYQKLVAFGGCMKDYRNNDDFQNAHVLNEFNMNGNSKSNRTYRIEIFPSLQMTYFNRSFSKNSYINKTCALSVIFAFTFGLLLGISIPFKYLEIKENNIRQLDSVNNSAVTLHREFNLYNDNKKNVKELPYISIISADDDKKIFDSFKRIYETVNIQKNISQVSFIRDMNDLEKSKNYNFINDSRKIKIKTLVQTEEVAVRYEFENSLEDETILSKDIYWGSKIENLLPKGFDSQKNDAWSKYVITGSVIKLESGCGRMQNRMATFSDGRRACVRYRQNLDQIQGEMFSFYLAQMLSIPNLPPSTVAIVNVTNPLWKNVASEIDSAQWNTNRPVVITQFIPDLEPALIPAEFKPSERHLNKFDIAQMNKRSDKDDLSKFVELAQWSDLILFDYLTANLDRIVNNLYNYQWNVNIMDAPAHNLAREPGSSLLVFLDNESGLLHGYRLLQKYEPFHRALLQGLCVFRGQTAKAIRDLHASSDQGGAGGALNAAFGTRADAALLDALPPLPVRNSRILQERIASLALHIDACRRRFSNH